LNIRGILTSAAAVVTAAAAAFAGPAAAAAPTSGGTGSAAGATSATGRVPHAVFSKNLHTEFVQARAHVTMGPRAGIVPPLTEHFTGKPNTKPAAGKLQPCTEPNCNLPYNSGPVQHKPVVYVDFFGPNWSTDTTGSQAYLLSLYQGLGASGDTWSLSTSQYSDGSGHPTFSKGVLVQYGFDTAAPPSEVTPSDTAAEAAAAATVFKIPDIPDAQVVVAYQSGTCFSDGFAGSSCTPVKASYCAWHSATTFGTGQLSFTNLPFLLDAGTSCGQDFINPSPGGDLDGLSIVGGHEYAESITDPIPPNGYIDLSDNVSGGENADKCAWAGEIWGTPDPAGDVTLATGSFAMQSLWSNAAGGCVMDGRLPFSVTPLKNQASAIGHAVSVQVHAATSPATPLVYSATGLPPGLSINPSTGLIHGTLSGPIKVYTSSVTVAYYAGSASFSFKWTAEYIGQVTGAWAKCLDNANGKTTAGNKIDIAACNGKAQQKITFTPTGQLQVQNGCITGSTKALFEPCSSATNRTWTRVGSEYVNKATGKCLTDPANSRTNGTQLTVATCANRVYQHWTLP
jgi:hypothetical protein